MRRPAQRFVAALGLAVAITILPHPGPAKEAANAIRTGSLSGAFLAARSAEADDDLDNAIAYYRQALVYDPDNTTLQQSLLVSLISNGAFEAALPIAEKLKAIPDAERYSRLALAVEAFGKKDYLSAQTYLTLAVESDLDRLITGLMRAWAKQGEGDTKGALAFIDGLKGPEWYRLFVTYHRGLIAAAAGRNEEAARAFEDILGNRSVASSAPDTFMRAAEAYSGLLARKNRKNDALDVIERAEGVYPGRLQMDVLRQRIEADTPPAPLVDGPAKGASEVLLNIASALNRGGGEAFVRLYLQYALALDPQNDAVLFQLGSVAEQRQRGDQAIGYYERISAGSPLKRLAELQRGLNLADLDRHDEAIRQLEVVLDEDPDDMRAYLALGGVHASREDYAKAADVYDRAVARIKEPGQADWNIFYQRGIAYERLKKWPEAEPNFRKALELFPDQPQVLNYLGYSWVDMDINLEEGLDLIRRAVELRPSDGYIVDSLGWAYYRLGRYDDAVRELERAVSLKPEDPILNDHLGDAYWRAGRRLEATFQWSHVIDREPEPDVLAQVQKKLREGMPPLEDKKKMAALVAPEDPAKMTDEGEADDKTGIMPSTRDGTDPADKESGVQAPAESPATAMPSSYRVRAGESLWSISSEQLGSGDRYREILDLNPELGSDPNLIYPGMDLKLPAGSQ